MRDQDVKGHIRALVDTINEREAYLNAKWTELKACAELYGCMRWRMVDCGKCINLHGPYLYLYHYEAGKLVEVYVGRRPERVAIVEKANDAAREIRRTTAQIRKLRKRLEVLIAREERVYQKAGAISPKT